MRLNVYLQKSGIGSRREGERMVADGRVSVNGEIATVTTPVEDGDEVSVDGKIVSVDSRPKSRLFILHKPLDVLCTTFDKEGRKTIFDLPVMKEVEKNENVPRLMNIGRLDVNSEGLLLMTSDGQLAQTMMSPKTGLERVYRVRIRGRLEEKEIKKLAKGITFGGVSYRGVKVEQDRKPTGANSWYTVTLTEGKNREIRKLMEYFGCVVNRLIRTKYGPFELGDLPKGQLMEIRPMYVDQFMEKLEKQATKD